MLERTALLRGPVTAVHTRCDPESHERPFVERHQGWTLAYVMAGSVGYLSAGAAGELVPGSLLVGRAGDGYVLPVEENAMIDHVGLKVSNLEASARFYGDALAPLGYYSPRYYAAFLLDPDGYNIEAVCFV